MNRYRNAIAALVVFAAGAPLVYGTLGSSITALGAEKPPVAATADAQHEIGACGSQASQSGQTLISFFFCSGDAMNVHYEGPNGSYTSSQKGTGSFGFSRCDLLLGVCEQASSGGKLLPVPAGSLKADGLMRTAVFDAKINGCDIHVTVNATSLPVVKSKWGHTQDPNTGQVFELTGGPAIVRDATQLSGTVCGQKIPNGEIKSSTGSLFRQLTGTLSLVVSTPPNSGPPAI